LVAFASKPLSTTALNGSLFLSFSSDYFIQIIVLTKQKMIEIPLAMILAGNVLSGIVVKYLHACKVNVAAPTSTLWRASCYLTGVFLSTLGHDHCHLQYVFFGG